LYGDDLEGDETQTKHGFITPGGAWRPSIPTTTTTTTPTPEDSLIALLGSVKILVGSSRVGIESTVDLASLGLVTMVEVQRMQSHPYEP